MKVLLGVVVSVLVLVGAFFLADAITRGIVQNTVADRLEENLPENVEGDVEVSIGGVSILAQLMTGSLDQVELSAPGLVVSGIPIAAYANGSDVPVAIDSRPVGAASGTITIAADDVARLIDLPGVSDGLVLGDGTVSYTGSAEFLGFSVDYTVTASLEADGDRVLLRPEAVQLGSAGNSVDVAGLVNQLIGQDAVPVCVAQYLPAGVSVSSITVTPVEAVVSFDADALLLDAEALSTRGSCA